MTNQVKIVQNQLYTSHIKENLSDNDVYSMKRNKETSKNVDINNLFKIYHQNIRGLRGKINEFMYSLLSETPHIICLTEHHLKDYEIDITPITKYKLCAKYCRRNLKEWWCMHLYSRILKIYQH